MNRFCFDLPPLPPLLPLPPPALSLVKRAMHGTRMLSWQEIREQYGREVVNLRNEGRWVFLNTLFSVSEAVMYMQVGGAAGKGGGGRGGKGGGRRCVWVLYSRPVHRPAVLSLQPHSPSS